jgi:5-methyltetrahydrofolate--homocysteine methyltransferase
MSTNPLINAIVELVEDEATRITTQELEGGTDPNQILDDCKEAMDIIGKRFETGEAFLPELMMAGEILKSISELIKPYLKSSDPKEKKATVVLGTVLGDIHDIAKDIVAFMLDINGFEVIDLGVDVAPELFVEKVKETGAGILALSGFLTLAYDPMKDTVSALKDAELDQTRVMIGGGQIDDYVRDYSGADAWGPDAMSAVRLAEDWTEKAKNKN